MGSLNPEVAEKPATNSFESEVGETASWLASPRFEGLMRLYSARQVVEQRGTIPTDYTVARIAAEQFYGRLRQLFAEHKQITTFGPYSPGQAVAIKRIGIEGIYLGGWATSAKGSVTEDPGPDLASYPLSQVPEEAAPIVRALLTADRNQRFARSRLSDSQPAAFPEIDYRPFIIADADTGHGGDAHVRNLIRRFVEVGVPGYHIEDQKPGAKKCGHQGGKVLVGVDEQIKRLSAARFQLDVMKVPGLIVARTDAEAATFLEGRGDERDHPFILGATNVELPTYKVGYLAILRKLRDLGVDDVRGHLLYKISAAEYDEASAWLERTGVMRVLEESAQAFLQADGSVEALLDRVETRFLETWQSEANLTSYPQAVAEVIEARASEGEHFGMSVGEWLAFANGTSFHAARAKARSMGVDITWDCEVSKTPEGYYQIRSGIDYAVARSLAAAPFSDLLWMETKTANLADARRFADAVHAEFPSKMLAYNLSPSFNWDTTGMSEEEMRRFPEELGELGFVFNFITYGGHQIDGMAAEEFATALKQDGMLSLARLQRKFRLVESPYRTPQGLDPAPAPGPDRGADQAARRMAGNVDDIPPDSGLAACRTAAAHGGLGVAGAQPVRQERREGRQRHLRRDRGSEGAQHPLGPGPEHLRRRPAQEAPDDAEPLVPGPPLQDLGGPLRQPDRRQSLPGPEDEDARALQRRPRRGRPRHRRGRECGGRQIPARPGPGPPECLDPAEVSV
jgi:isocitrate lyase